MKTGKEIIFQILAFFEIFPDHAFADRIALAVFVENILQSLLKSDDLVMFNPLVGVIDEFDRSKNTLGVQIT